MAVVDIATFVADLKDVASDHGFHVHDERHFVETYSMRQAWEIDLHPEHGCGGPLDLHMSIEIEPRTMLAFEDAVIDAAEGMDRPIDGNIVNIEPDEAHQLPIILTWALPPLAQGPDLLVLATDLAGIGGPDLPLEVSAVDAYASLLDAPERSVSIISRCSASLARIYSGQEDLGEILPRAAEVCTFLLDRAPAWMGDL